MIWTREAIVDALRGYLTSKAQAQHLSVRIAELDALIQKRARTLTADAATDSPAPLDGMPRGSGTGNPVERVGIALADGWEPDDLKELRAEKAAAQARLQTVGFKVKYVEAWLSGLCPDERELVTAQLIEGRHWRELTQEYEKRAGDYVTKDALKRLKYQALTKIERIANGDGRENAPEGL